MLISIILVLNLSSQFFFNSDVNNYSCLGRRRKGASEKAAKERGTRRTSKNGENSFLLPRGKITHLVIIPGQLYCAFIQPTSSAGYQNRNHNTKSISEKSRLDSPQRGLNVQWRARSYCLCSTKSNFGNRKIKSDSENVIECEALICPLQSHG